MSYSLWPYGLQHARIPCPSVFSWSLLKFMSIASVMLSNHLILCHPCLLLPSIFLSIRVFSVSQLFASGGQNFGASTSASVLPMNIQAYIHIYIYICTNIQASLVAQLVKNPPAMQDIWVQPLGWDLQIP